MFPENQHLAICLKGNTSDTGSGTGNIWELDVHGSSPVKRFVSKCHPR